MRSATALAILLSVAVSTTLHAYSGGIYWISPAGTSSWANCRSDTDPGGTYCSLATANANLKAGDTAYLKGGTYDNRIAPANSGTGVNARISYMAVPGEIAIILNTTDGGGFNPPIYYGVFLRNRSYIRIDGITIHNSKDHISEGSARLMELLSGSSYNEIANSVFDGFGGGIIRIWDGTPQVGVGNPCVHNWLHGNTIKNTGRVTANCDDLGGFQLGVPSYDNHSNYNTFENNVWFCGGHHNLETFTKYNVISNNFFHHEGCMPGPQAGCGYGPESNGLWGNRNLQIYDGHNEGKFNLIEGNRFGPSGPPPDDDGGDGLTLTAPENIVRYNEIYGAQNNGLLMKMGWQSASNNNRVYNNTIFKSGRHRNTGPQWQGTGIRFYPSQTVSAGNAFVNNIIVDSHGADVAHARDSKATNTLFNNWFTNSERSGDSDASPYYGDPMFLDVGMDIFPASRQRPDLSLKSGSGAIDAGAHLTRAKGDGSNLTRLVVEDALYFQDGSWGSSLAGHQADWIAVGSVDKVVQIESIDYSSNTISISYPISWSDGDRIWLYQKSDGARVLYGCSPDIGAKESHASAPCGLVAPQSLRLVQ